MTQVVEEYCESGRCVLRKTQFQFTIKIGNDWFFGSNRQLTQEELDFLVKQMKTITKNPNTSLRIDAEKDLTEVVKENG